VPEVGLVLSSPFVRAWRTAEILEQTGWPAPVRCEELEPDCPPHKVLSVLARHEDLDSVAIVGHRPGLHELISYLLTGDTIGEECGARVQIKKGGVARLSFDGIPEPGLGLPRMGAHAESAAGRRRQALAAGCGWLAVERNPREGLELGVRGGAQGEQGDLDALDGDLAHGPVAIALDSCDELVGGERTVRFLEVGQREVERSGGLL
jgi:phosphohistidine phosphatase SixA